MGPGGKSLKVQETRGRRMKKVMGAQVFLLLTPVEEISRPSKTRHLTTMGRDTLAIRADRGAQGVLVDNKGEIIRVMETTTRAMEGLDINQKTRKKIIVLLFLQTSICSIVSCFFCIYFLCSINCKQACVCHQLCF